MADSSEDEGSLKSVSSGSSIESMHPVQVSQISSGAGEEKYGSELPYEYEPEYETG